jgi:signal transduction histidine kinase
MDRAPHQWLDLHEGLYATLTMLKPKLSGIQLVKDVDKSLPRIPGYPAELNQVWTNLIENARDAMDGSGTLTIRTRRDGDCAVVEIEDTGPGIPPEIRTRIFEPFFTTKPVGQGTGLGLDVSFRVVVNRHHGDLRVDSEPGRTVFRVTLPMAEAGEGTPTPPPT